MSRIGWILGIGLLWGAALYLPNNPVVPYPFEISALLFVVAIGLTLLRIGPDPYWIPLKVFLVIDLVIVFVIGYDNVSLLLDPQPGAIESLGTFVWPVLVWIALPITAFVGALTLIVIWFRERKRSEATPPAR